MTWSRARLEAWRSGKSASRSRRGADDVLHIDAEPSIEPDAFRRALAAVVRNTVTQEVQRRCDPDGYNHERFNARARAEERGLGFLSTRCTVR